MKTVFSNTGTYRFEHYVFGFCLNQLRLLGDDGLPLYDLCRYREVWVKVTALMLYLQKAKTSGVRPDYSVFAQQHSATGSTGTAAVASRTTDARSRTATAGGVHVTSSSSAADNEARRRYLREGLPMYSSLCRSVSMSDDVAGVCSAATSCEDRTREVGQRETVSRQENSTSAHTRL